jgi:hypothetical protein
MEGLLQINYRRKGSPRVQGGKHGQLLDQSLARPCSKKHGSAQLVRKSSMPLSRLESFKGQYPYELSSGGEVARFGSVWPYEQPLVETPPNKKPAL